MTVETLNARTTSRKKRTAEEKTAAKPNYILLVIGLVLVLVQILMVSGRIPSPVPNAALLALGVTLALYGIYPVTVMQGEFTGLLGSLAVTGPAALGLFLFAYTLHSMNNEPYTDDFFVLTTSSTDQRHNSRTIDGATIRLLDVDSFADDKIAEIISHLETTLRDNGVSDPRKSQKEARRLLASVVPQLLLKEPYQTRAIAVINAYPGNPPGGSDEAWAAIIAEAAKNASEPKEVLRRVKKLPFAVIKVTEEQPPFRIVSENGHISAGSRTYDVPVIANPSKKSAPNLQEAVVLAAAAR